MKKVFRFLGIIVLISVIGFLIVTCDNGNGNDPCKDGHDFSGSWVTDATDHWKACTRTNCNEIGMKDEHDFINGECTVCGRTETTTGCECDDDCNDPDCECGCDDTPIPNTYTGTQINIINAQVYDENGDPINDNITITEFFGLSKGGDISDRFTSYTVDITDGKLNLTLGAPKNDALNTIIGWYDGFTADPTDAKMLVITNLEWDDGMLQFKSGNSWIYFFYVDKEVTINRSGNPNFNNITLQPGWNTLKQDEHSVYYELVTVDDDTCEWVVTYWNGP